MFRNFHGTQELFKFNEHPKWLIIDSEANILVKKIKADSVFKLKTGKFKKKEFFFVRRSQHDKVDWLIYFREVLWEFIQQKTESKERKK